MAEKKKPAAKKKAPAKKPAAKKAPAKKAAPKAVEVPENPDRHMGAPVRTIRCDKAKAARLVGEFGFFVITEADGVYECVADSTANAKYEAQL